MSKALSLYLEIKDPIFLNQVLISHCRAIDSYLSVLKLYMQKIDQTSVSHCRDVYRSLNDSKLQMQKVYRILVSHCRVVDQYLKVFTVMQNILNIKS